jgi:1-acyl-sn-glycerol-3-phosphate acyltransferase
MLMGAVGFFLNHIPLLLFSLFCMGSHSAFFGPIKYSILPRHLREQEIMSGNALVEMGTFLAILLGTLMAGLLFRPGHPILLVCVLLGLSILGWLSAKPIPKTEPADPHLKINWNPVSQTWALTQLIHKKASVFHSILGISWYWFFGATVLVQIPNFVRHCLHGNTQWVTLILCVFSLSIGVGAWATAKLSRGDIELGLVPLGTLGLTVFASHLAFLTYPPDLGPLLGIRDLLRGPLTQTGYKVLFDFAALGISGSLFIVPLYALVQMRSDAESRSRVIAANNIYNALFMVVASLITMVLLKFGYQTLEVLLFIAILNLVVSVYIFTLIPEFVMRFLLWILAATLYRLRYQGRHHIPKDGAALLIANHVSFIDWFVIVAACRRPVRFVMDSQIFKIPVLNLIFKISGAIPIASAKVDPAIKEKAFVEISQALRDGELVCIFPEGKITLDGQLNPFMPGAERILKLDPVPVIPIALDGLYGSFFSRKGGPPMSRMPKPSRRVISVQLDAAMPPSTTRQEMQAKVEGMLRKANAMVSA